LVPTEVKLEDEEDLEEIIIDTRSKATMLESNPADQIGQKRLKPSSEQEAPAIKPRGKEKKYK
jgi:hypothetical protein